MSSLHLLPLPIRDRLRTTAKTEAGLLAHHRQKIGGESRRRCVVEAIRRHVVVRVSNNNFLHCGRPLNFRFLVASSPARIFFTATLSLPTVKPSSVTTSLLLMKYCLSFRDCAVKWRRVRNPRAFTSPPLRQHAAPHLSNRSRLAQVNWCSEKIKSRQPDNWLTAF